MIPDEPNVLPSDGIQEVPERGKEKQLEKEIPWEHIPPTERDGGKNMHEHLDFQAVQPLSWAEWEEVRTKLHPSRTSG